MEITALPHPAFAPDIARLTKKSAHRELSPALEKSMTNPNPPSEMPRFMSSRAVSFHSRQRRVKLSIATVGPKEPFPVSMR
jgi:hypothetical protein